MCEYCNPDKLNTLIESTKIGNMIWWGVGHILKKEHIDEVDNSVVLEVRNGQGYLRLGDRDDMNCIDHEEKIEINYCPICGRRLNSESYDFNRGEKDKPTRERPDYFDK